MTELLEQFSDGSIRSLARVLTRIENRAPGSFGFLSEIFARTGRARIVGITGSPGAGKSTLVDKLARRFLVEDGPMAAIVAVDPTSPFSRGAILGDRIRMQEADAVGRVFIRSMATRGHLGGLAAATADVITTLDAWGMDPVIIETVGVGQDEIDIARLADVSVVVLVPGQGDDIQALKAGIMEIGDIFVINKCDHPGADKLEQAIRASLELAGGRDATPPILRTIATRGDGVDDLRREIDRCHQTLTAAEGRSVRKKLAAREQIVRLLEHQLVGYALSAYGDSRFEAALGAIVERKQNPYSLVNEILEVSGLRRLS